MNNAWKPLGAACLLVIGVYAYTARLGALQPLTQPAADNYYNLLVRGFRDGQLSLKKEAPPALAQLADPYSATPDVFNQSGSGRTMDMSYYKGRLYLYFGVTPALLLFWPFVALTGHYLSHGQAVVIFCAVGFLASAALLFALWRRYFAEVSVWVVVACTLALGLATGVPLLVSASDVYEVAISCGYMLTMLTLAAMWRAVHEPERGWRWLAVASVAYGLAVGARPNLLFGGPILLVPLVQSWRERRRVWGLLMAATVPILLIGFGLMLYNELRFDNPFEFGIRYQLAGQRQVTQQFFGLRNLWFNVRVYFLKSVGWSRHFPFVQPMTSPPLPPGHGNMQRPFGILTDVPLVWLALAVPLAWRSQSTPAASILRWFVLAVALLFGISASSLCLFRGASFRYEADFLPALVLLAVVGILGLERWLADRLVWRRAVRCGWGLLLGFSVAVNLCICVEDYAISQYYVGTTLWQKGKSQEAIGYFEHALRIKPEYAQAHCDMGVALQQEGKIEDAIGHFEEALRLRPDRALVHYDLAGALMQAGRVQEAISHWERALQLKPDFVEAHYNLGTALAQTGKIEEAIAHYQQALQIRPDYAEARDALARLQSHQ
ncbi:MAG TPA: tetratricopeptide repeat protein [Verrucomicrobiae bacterium]|nr:tetratricopeptide repeat protein [Verrucomicrobiae bacterium]